MPKTNRLKYVRCSTKLNRYYPLLLPMRWIWWPVIPRWSLRSVLIVPIRSVNSNGSRWRRRFGCSCRSCWSPRCGRSTTIVRWWIRCRPRSRRITNRWTCCVMWWWTRVWGFPSSRSSIVASSRPNWRWSRSGERTLRTYHASRVRSNASPLRVSSYRNRAGRWRWPSCSYWTSSLTWRSRISNSGSRWHRHCRWAIIF